MRLLKHLYPHIAAGLLIAAASSCDVHEFPTDPIPPMPATELLLQFNDGDMPLLTTVDYDPIGRSRTSAQDARFIVHVYPDNDASESRTGTRVPTIVSVITDHETTATDSRVIPLQIEAGTYRVLVWSDFVDAGSELDKYYSTDNLSEIELISANSQADSEYAHQGNTTYREAYRGEQRISIDANGTVTHIDGTPTSDNRAIVPMNRPMARFAFITTDLAEFASRHSGSADGTSANLNTPNPDDYRVIVRYTSYMPSAYNAHTDKPVNSRTGVYFDGRIERLDDTQASLGYDYVLVNGSNTSVQVALDVYSRADGTLLASTDPIDIPLQRNRLTLVRGPFLTTKSGSGMGIDPGFYDDFNIEIL